MLVSGLRPGLGHEVFICRLVEEGSRPGEDVVQARIRSESTTGARFNEIEIALILIERVRADQVVPAPVQGGLGLW